MEKRVESIMNLGIIYTVIVMQEGTVVGHVHRRLLAACTLVYAWQATYYIHACIRSEKHW